MPSKGALILARFPRHHTMEANGTRAEEKRMPFSVYRASVAQGCLHLTPADGVGKEVSFPLAAVADVQRYS